MRYRALDIFMGTRPCGLLFQYGEGPTAMTRFVPEPEFWMDADAPVMGHYGRQENETDRALFLADAAQQAFFNGTGERLPPFFQNLLPEGPLRKHLEQLRGCKPGDHMDILAMCGEDLPGNVYARPTKDDRASVAAVVTQGNDALEMSVIDQPLAGATSLSGIQPKLGLVESKGRYVARTRDIHSHVHIIAKLPTAEYPLLPEVEELSLRLAHAAGVETCHAVLCPVTDILPADQPYTVEGDRQFLAVHRFDRMQGAHIHCEDFAQVLDIDPDYKYQDPAGRMTYANMLIALLKGMQVDPAQGLEFFRRLMVNQLLGNYDAHGKNYGVIYRDGVTPVLSPAYDVVAYAAYLPGKGHALRFHAKSEPRARISPAVVRELCNLTGLLEPLVKKALTETVEKARLLWAPMIEQSGLLDVQKQRLLDHIQNDPNVEAQTRRSQKRSKPEW
jgi:serine/threonine-protein kinase HipA